MRGRIILAIARKELLETVRDRRTLVLMLFLPVVLYPLLLVGFSQIIAHQVTQLDARTGTVQVWGQAPPELLAQLRRDARFNVVEAPAPRPLPETFRLVPMKPEKRPGMALPSAPPERETAMGLPAAASPVATTSHPDGTVRRSVASA